MSDEMFDAAAWAVFTSKAPTYRSMHTAIRDRFALYCLADGSGELRGCIDTVARTQVWIPSHGHYRPVVQFSGWRPL